MGKSTSVPGKKNLSKTEKGVLASEQDESTPINEISSFALNITIKTPRIAQYLASIPPEELNDKVEEILNVGILAIESASPSLNTEDLDQHFQEIDRSLEDFTKAFKNNIEKELTAYLKAENSKIAEKLHEYFSDRSQMALLFKEYFCSDGNPKLGTQIQEIIGENSPLGNFLDCTNTEGLSCTLENKLTEVLDPQTKEALKELSFDEPTSMVNMLKTKLGNTLDVIKKNSVEIQTRIQDFITQSEKIKAEKQRGSYKGFEFEDIVYEILSQYCYGTGDYAASVGGATKLGFSKKGDVLLTLGPNSGVADENIIIEAKKNVDYAKDIAKSRLELAEAKKNVNAKVGIFVYGPGCAPKEVHGIYCEGPDFYCEMYDDPWDDFASPIYFMTAVRLARAYIIAQKDARPADMVPLDAVENIIKDIYNTLENYDEYYKKSLKIGEHLSDFQSGIQKLKTDMVDQLNGLLLDLESELDLKSST